MRHRSKRLTPESERRVGARAAACVTVKVYFGGTVPVRLDVVVLVATLYVTDPLPGRTRQ
jgi:hypothetical protein